MKGRPILPRPSWVIAILIALVGISSVSGYYGGRGRDDDYGGRGRGDDYGGRGWASQFGSAQLLERFSWKVLDWAFPDENSKEIAIANGEYIPENGLPVGIEVWRNKLFVTVPRWRDGIPGTLNWINLDENLGGSPKLTPWPSWEQNRQGACNSAITTAYRIHADQCNRLWVLDTGTVGIGNSTVQVCPYVLNVFDLTTDTIIRRYPLKASDTNANTFIANIAVDMGKGGCDDAFAYMSDELGYGLIVYDWQANNSWRITHSYFMPDPLAGDYNIGGLNFQWGDEGIFGMAVSPLASDGYRTLFFHPLSSNREFAVSTQILRDEQLALDSYHQFQPLAQRYMGHSTAELMDENGVMLFTLIDQNAVGCWNSRFPYTPANQAVIARHDEALIFPADVKVTRGVVWMISDRMPNFLLSSLDYSDVNFRILTVPMQEAIAGTVCQTQPYRFGSGNNALWWDR